MTISFVGVDSGNTGLLAATAIVRNVPVGTANGDRMFASIVGTEPGFTITPPAGWTEVALIVNETAHEQRLYTRIAAAEPANYTWTFSGAQSGIAAIITLRGVASFTATNNSDTLSLLDHITPTIAINQADGWLLTIFSGESVLAAGWAPPVGMTERWDQIGGIALVLNATGAGDTEGPLPTGMYTRTTTTLLALDAINTIIALEAASTVPVGATTELDTADFIAASLVAPINGALETDTALPIAPAVAGQLNQAIEIDDAFAVVASFSLPLGDASEMDIASGIFVNSALEIGLATEMDSAGLIQIPITPLAPTVSGDHHYTPGPCELYPYELLCTLPPEVTPAMLAVAVQSASEFLYYATAQRFDRCQVTIRPCRRDCYDTFPANWWYYGSYPTPVKIEGTWYNIACSACGDTCSCTNVSETVLPGPVQRIVQVTLDGVVLTSDVDYRLDEYRKLVRLGDIWPYCNDLNRDITQTGTWSVTAIYGEPFPALGKLAMGELICDIISDLLGADCNLPANVTSLTRQGVTVTMDSVAEALEAGLYNLKWVDRFIRVYNPNQLMARAAVYDIDGPSFRVTGTTIP